jgi:hypothetical protein
VLGGGPTSSRPLASHRCSASERSGETARSASTSRRSSASLRMPSGLYHPSDLTASSEAAVCPTSSVPVSPAILGRRATSSAATNLHHKHVVKTTRPAPSAPADASCAAMIVRGVQIRRTDRGRFGTFSRPESLTGVFIRVLTPSVRRCCSARGGCPTRRACEPRWITLVSGPRTDTGRSVAWIGWPYPERPGRPAPRPR